MLIEVINGLLGAGKTTFLLNILEQKGQGEKAAVLVNEFGEIGIDGDILSGQGADVIELPNGCICCTLNADLRNQIRIIAETYHPDRLIIEPTGVATIKNLLGILKSLSLEKYIDEIKITVVIDASTFGEFLSQNRGFIETQVQMAEHIIINKCDKVNLSEINKIIAFIKNVNSTGQIQLTAFGRVLDKTVFWGINAKHQSAEQNRGEHRHHSDETHDDKHHEHNHEHNHEEPLKDYEQFSTSSDGIFQLEKLKGLFDKLKNGDFGDIDRAKGIFHITGGSWVRLDLASDEISEFELNRGFAVSKVMVIGTQLLTGRLMEGFKKCQA